jgi:hypothetical protein
MKYIFLQQMQLKSLEHSALCLDELVFTAGELSDSGSEESDTGEDVESIPCSCHMKSTFDQDTSGSLTNCDDNVTEGEKADSALVVKRDNSPNGKLLSKKYWRESKEVTASRQNQKKKR